MEQEGYSVNYSVVNMADFGLPQARRRLVLIANKGFHVALPLGTAPCMNLSENALNIASRTVYFVPLLGWRGSFIFPSH
ncbi:DNA cytosine methyltransferase [Nostoc sp.]|uniref:DNA cytosine methyltransferase n=1 Tax=Nostoc sp. TaxID=1180 RepID=UPI002FF61FFB